MEDIKLAQFFADSSLAIAGAFVAAILILNLKSIIGATKEAIAEVNRGKKQDADSLAAMQSELIRASQDAIDRSITVVTRAADDMRRRMEEMERELRDMRVESALDKKRITEQAAEITELKARVIDLQRQLDTKAVDIGEDGSGKKRSRRAPAAAGK